LNRVDGDGDGEAQWAERDVALSKDLSKLFDGAADALLRGVVAQAQGAAHGVKIPVLEIAQENRFTIGLVQLSQSVIQMRRRPPPSGVRRRRTGVARLTDRSLFHVSRQCENPTEKFRGTLCLPFLLDDERVEVDAAEQYVLRQIPALA